MSSGCVGSIGPAGQPSLTGMLEEAAKLKETEKPENSVQPELSPTVNRFSTSPICEKVGQDRAALVLHDSREYLATVVEP